MGCGMGYIEVLTWTQIVPCEMFHTAAADNMPWIGKLASIPSKYM
jgi:hypothetical protein